MRSRRETHTLPDGTTTRNWNTYVATWRKHAAPIVRATGWECSAFDPGLAFLLPNNHTVDLPPPVAAAFRQAVLRTEAAEARLAEVAGGER